MIGEAFPAFLDRINQEWVKAARRLSPTLLIQLLGVVGEQIVDFWHTLGRCPEFRGTSVAVRN